MSWIIIAVIILAFVVVSKFIHFHHAKNKIFALLAILLIGVLIFTFFSVAQNNSVNLKTASGLFSAVKIYFSWIGNAFGNIQVLTGNAVRMNWAPNLTG